MVDMNFDYPKIEHMAASLDRGAQQLEQTKQQIHRAAHGFNQGTFEGLAGQALADGLANQLGPSIDRLIERYREMAKDLRQSAQEMQQLDSGKVAGQF
jgi:WXG100 family type VII secretion target